MASIEDAAYFLERRIDLGLETDKDALLVYDRCITLGNAVVNAQYEELERERQARLTQNMSAEQRLQKLLERARREREERAKEPAAVAAHRQRYRQRQQAIVAAGERVLDGLIKGGLE